MANELQYTPFKEATLFRQFDDTNLLTDPINM